MPAMNSDDGNRTSENYRLGGGGGGGGGGRCMTLTRDESVRGMECVRGVECYSPARVALCRLLAVVKKCKGRKREKVPAKEVEKREVVSRQSSLTTVGRRRNDHGSGEPRQEMTFNMAAGLGLLSLIAASKTELDKTAELRRQMEMFLRNARDGQDVQGSTRRQSETECTYAVSTTIDGLSNLSSISQEDHAPALSQQESGISFVCDKHCDDLYQSEGCLDGINHLEEELEAELERLQLDIETEGELSENQPDEVTEISSNGNATGTVTISSGEVINPNDADADADANTNYNNAVIQEHCGVPPLELERRLHELLEARQQERIKELEDHLNYMKRKLEEKEVEVIWWKDTAKLISKQVPESSRAKVVCEG